MLQFNLSHLDPPSELEKIQSASNKVFESKSSFEKSLEFLLIQTYKQIYNEIEKDQSKLIHPIHVFLDDINTIFYEICYNQFPLMSAAKNDTIKKCKFILSCDIDSINCPEPMKNEVFLLNGIK